MSGLALARIVQLETAPEARLGTISRVLVEPDTGDLLLSDRDATSAVYRFTADGRFVARFGPVAERDEPLLDFAVRSDGTVVLTTDQRAVEFDADGKRLRSVHLPFAIWNFSRGREGFFGFVVAEAGGPVRNSVVVLDDGLRVKDRSLPPDPRHLRHGFLPLRAITSEADGAVVLDLLAPEVVRYDSDLRPLERVRFALAHGGGDPDWTPTELSEEQKREIRRRTHRFQFVASVKDGLLLLERCSLEDIYRLVVADSALQGFRSLPNLPILGERAPDDWVPRTIVGAWPEGVVAVLPDEEALARARSAGVPGAVVPEYDPHQNPPLAFIRVAPTCN